MSVLLFFAFLLGIAFGLGCFLAYGAYQVHKIQKTRDKLLGELKKKAEEAQLKSDSIKERLVKASELAQAQMALRAQAEMPSKNALHSQYKNGLVAEIADLEQKKLDLLKTVLAEGFDPVITVVNDNGSKEEMALSEYVNVALADLGQRRPSEKLPETPPTSPGEPKRAGKFIVYTGGKNDGTTH